MTSVSPMKTNDLNRHWMGCLLPLALHLLFPIICSYIFFFYFWMVCAVSDFYKYIMADREFSPFFMIIISFFFYLFAYKSHRTMKQTKNYSLVLPWHRTEGTFGYVHFVPMTEMLASEESFLPYKTAQNSEEAHERKIQQKARKIALEHARYLVKIK